MKIVIEDCNGNKLTHIIESENSLKYMKVFCEQSKVFHVPIAQVVRDLQIVAEREYVCTHKNTYIDPCAGFGFYAC